MSSESVVIARGGYSDFEKILIIIHCLHYSRKEKLEFYIFIRCFSRIYEVFSLVRADGPVIVLS